MTRRDMLFAATAACFAGNFIPTSKPKMTQAQKMAIIEKLKLEVLMRNPLILGVPAPR